MTDDQYQEMLTLVETEENSSGYGLDVPKRYYDAIDAVESLDAGGSLYITKSYSVGEENLDWSKADATFRIECLDALNSFKPLSVTLSDLEINSLSGDFYNVEADGWTNKYILPAGTYKVTEIGYTAVTEKGKKLVTAASYEVNGAVRSDYAIVTVKEDEECSVAVMNNYGKTSVAASFVDQNGDAVSGAELLMSKPNSSESYTFNSSNNYTCAVDNCGPGDSYSLSITAPNGYTGPDLEGIKFTPNGSVIISPDNPSIEAIDDELYNGVLKLIVKFNKLDANTGNNDQDQGKTDVNKTEKDSVANTGDNFNLLAMLAIMMFTAAAMTVVISAGRRRG